MSLSITIQQKQKVHKIRFFIDYPLMTHLGSIKQIMSDTVGAQILVSF